MMASFVGGTFIEQWIPLRNQSDCADIMCGNKQGGGLDHRQTINPMVCGSLYNGHIAPFVNQTIAGFVWYQVRAARVSLSSRLRAARFLNLAPPHGRCPSWPDCGSFPDRGRWFRSASAAAPCYKV